MHRENIFGSQKRQELKFRDGHPALVIYNGFRGQTTEDISAKLAENNIITIQIPATCTDKLQPIVYVAITKPMKDFLRSNYQIGIPRR